MGPEIPVALYGRKDRNPMTQLMSDPIDHWLDLDVQSPREPLRLEMLSALDEALDAPADPPYRRAAWTGVFTGYAVAFGIVTREALDRARHTPGALCAHPEDLKIGFFTDAATCWASGVLYGYLMGTSEHPDADVCATCGQRIVTSVDDFEACADGRFCPFGCNETFHANGPSVCAMEGSD